MGGCQFSDLDLSEQEALECGYDPPDVMGCDGALPDSYVGWIIDNGGYMSGQCKCILSP